ncbi:unnamed protein product [Microthlaspi erraticum]|uniref:DUF1985 domain-containing protein n=2 Tax=Microthlaspi erraticum TaxID=1685480 RepID=A0A6D2KXV9_9BRAS|nr:unnamed protein product [Microthlaspi erraticum]
MARTKNPEFPLEQTHPSEINPEEDPPTERVNNSEEEDTNPNHDEEDWDPNPNEEADKEADEEADESDGSRSSGTLSDREEEEDGSDLGEETEAMQPLQMYFPPSEYRKKIKISTRCYIADTMKTLLHTLDPPLTSRKRSWFETHPQFQHIFHMPRDNNHKVQAMWMLLLRTACTEKEKEAWFVVNGVPIRYSIKEHALISGLDCHNYPLEFMQRKSMGTMKYVEKFFKKGSKIRHQDVKAKLLKMGAHRDRLNIAVLFFLSSIIKGLVKTGNDAPSVDPFLLRAVSDLELCRTFPWGRLSFDHMLHQITHTMNHFGGFVKEGGKSPILWPIGGFYIPLELLPFEAIPALGLKFREPVAGADKNCPRMCRSKFKSCEMKGFPLPQINGELGTTKDIESILIPSRTEKTLLRQITEKKEDDKHCVVVQSWMDRLGDGFTIFFENMFKEDVDAKVREVPANVAVEDVDPIEPPVNGQSASLVDLMDRMKKEMDERMTKMEETFDGLVDKVDGLSDKVDGLVERIAPLEAYVNEQSAYMRTYEEGNDGREKAHEKEGDDGGEKAQEKAEKERKKAEKAEEEKN